MPDKNRNQFNSNPARERFSNFVVDLRTISQTPRPTRPVAPSAGNRFQSEWSSLKNAVKRIRPNLLPSENKSVFRFFRGRRPKNNLLSSFKNWSPSLPRFKKESGWSRVRAWFMPVPRSPWQKFVRSQEKIFDSLSRPRLNKKTAARGIKHETREDRPVIWYRSLLSFVCLLLIIIAPFKIMAYFQLWDLSALESKIIKRSESAINNLMAAADSVSHQDFKGADSEFQAAGANFLAAQEDLGQINDSLLSLASLSSDPKIRLAAESKKFLTAGAIASSLGRNLVLATDSLFNGDKTDFAKTLDNFLSYGDLAVSDAQKLKTQINEIDPANLPDAYRTKFTTLAKQAGLLTDNLSNFVATGEKLKEVLGLSRDKRYLLVFQNNSELRASGGFIGSYALIDFRDGKIRNLEVPGGGSYDTEGGMKVSVAAPEPLWLVSPAWHFWDANWWPDWPTTAQNLMWFYEKSDGPSVDGVIGITPTVVERLLEITGPIDLTAEYGLTIDSNNFWETVQKITEQKNLAKTNPASVSHLPESSLPVQSSLPLQQGLEVNSANKPKKIIGDLMAKILEVLPQKLNQKNLLKIIAVFEENMSEKQILLYFTDPTLQSEVASHNWAGEVKKTDKDYLMVVNTNIAGQKSDRLMSEKIDQSSVASSDGTIINTVTITRTHTGLKNEPLTGVRNVDWLRVYVPEGSELLSAEGFQAPDPEYLRDKPDASAQILPALTAERAARVDQTSGTKIYNENDKTVFANWLMVDPGQTAVVTIKYRLPFNLLTKVNSDSWLERLNSWLNPEAQKLIPYSLLVQKQPGAKPSAFTSRLVTPTGLKIFWRYPEDLAGSQGWEIKADLDGDKYWSVLMEDNK